MPTLEEILTIERRIKSTENSGEEIPNLMFAPLKTMVTETILKGIAAKDRRIRSASLRVSRRFTEISIEHQKRVLNAMSNRL